MRNFCGNPGKDSLSEGSGHQRGGADADFEFDETMNSREVGGKLLLDYWGYNTVGFFAPNSNYASTAEFNREGDRA